jgi:hypothetical protein
MEATMVRILRAKTQHAIRKVARRGAKTVRSVAGDALGAAAKAAAGVVLDSTAKVLEAGRSTVQRSAPAMERAAGRAARRTITGHARKKSPTRRKARAAKRKVKRRTR